MHEKESLKGSPETSIRNAGQGHVAVDQSEARKEDQGPCEAARLVGVGGDWQAN